jgi:hypothetical protein
METKQDTYHLSVRDFVAIMSRIEKVNERVDSLTEDMNKKLADFENELSRAKEVSNVKITERDRELLDYLRTHNEYKKFAGSKNVSPTAIFNRLRKLQKYGLVVHIGRKWCVR